MTTNSKTFTDNITPIDAAWLNDQDAQAFDEVNNIKRYGAVMDGSTSDQTAVADAFAANSTQIGKVIYVPPMGSLNYAKVTAALSVPRYNGQTIRGGGRRASRLTQATANTTLISAAHDWATGSTNGLHIGDMMLTAPVGTTNSVLYLEGAQRSTLQNLYVSGGKFGLQTKDLLSLQVHNCNFDTSNYAFYSDGSGSNTGPNQYSWVGNYVSGVTAIGIYTVSAYAWLFVGNGVESCAQGGLKIDTNGGGVFSAGSYYENNQDGASASFDISIGATASIQGLAHVGNYHNGRAAGATYDYKPIRIKNASANYFANNFFNVGNRAFKFEANAVLLDCVFGPEAYQFTGGSPFDVSDPSTVYEGLPSTFCQSRSRITDFRVVPTDGANLFQGTGPFGWTTSLGSGSTFGESSTRLGGRLAADFVRTTNAAQISRSVTVSSTTNSRARGKYVTGWLIAYFASTSDQLTVTLGDGVGTTAATFSGLSGEQFLPVTRFFGSSATKAELIVDIATNNVTFITGDYGVFVGADPYSTQRTGGTPDFALADLTGSATYDPPSIAAGVTIVAATTITVTGARVGDMALVSHSDSSTANADKVEFRGKVSAADTITVFVTNLHSGAIDLASGTMRARVVRR